jgi:hypothetical protein
MNLFITLLENVNKSRTSANNVSLMNVTILRIICFEFVVVAGRGHVKS